MWAMLAGVPGKLKTLIDRLTATRAANLDNLNATISSRMPGTATEQGRIDVAISSRAPSSTALSNATWTDTKAGFLDAAVSSRAPSSTALSNVTWTNTRAALLDNLSNLDTTVSSRAPASTALSTSVWTSTHAARIDTTISSRAAASTALSTAQWTNTRAAYLDNIHRPPIATDFPTNTQSNSSNAISSALIRNATGASQSTTSSSTLVDAVNITGSGVLKFCLYTHSSSSAPDIQIVVTIDGVAIYNVTQPIVPQNMWRAIIGAFSSTASGITCLAYEDIPFRTSCRIQIRSVNGNPAAVVIWKLHRTS